MRWLALQGRIGSFATDSILRWGCAIDRDAIGGVVGSGVRVARRVTE
jgi:hypothetical protein